MKNQAIGILFIYVLVMSAISFALSFDSTIKCESNYKVYEVIIFPRVVICEVLRPFGNFLIGDL